MTLAPDNEMKTQLHVEDNWISEQWWPELSHEDSGSGTSNSVSHNIFEKTENFKTFKVVIFPRSFVSCLNLFNCFAVLLKIKPTVKLT